MNLAQSPNWGEIAIANAPRGCNDEYIACAGGDAVGESKPIRVLVIDDSAAVLDGIASILRGAADIRAASLLTDGADAAQRASEDPPDVVLLDSQMPARDAASVIREIKARAPQVGVLLMAVHADCIDAALDAGADGYMGKDSSPSELAAAIWRVARRPSRAPQTISSQPSA